MKIVDKPIARRYNDSKLRYELISPIALEKLAEVYTKGASKYTLFDDAGNMIEDGANNWKKGLPFTDVIASAKRHIHAWEQGEDIDPDLKSSHLANAMWNIATLLHYTETNPEMDNRDLWYKKPFKKLWLDLDGVIFDFEKSLLEEMGLPADRHATDWNDPVFRHGYDELKGKESFWRNLPILIQPVDLKYPIAGYCTSRSNCPNEITQQVLDYYGFPTAPIINSGSEPKSKFLLEVGCDVMVDDSIQNFVDCQSNGIVCYLMSRPHNTKYNVGHWRINNLQELFDKLMS